MKMKCDSKLNKKNYILWKNILVFLYEIVFKDDLIMNFNEFGRKLWIKKNFIK